MSALEIGVLGAGVVGLTTAIELKKQWPNASVTVLADKFTTDTTSDGAAGVFRPGNGFCGPDDYTTRKWINDSYNYWDNIQCKPESPKMGIIEISGYIFSKNNKDIVRNSYIEKLVPIYRSTTEEELSICPGNWKYGSFFKTLLIECGIYLPWAMAHFKNIGGIIKQQKIGTFSELNGTFDVVVNCTGLGAKYLCNDHKLVPIRGQVIKVQAPFVKTCFYGEFDTYIIPGFRAVTLGGTRQYDSYNLSVNRYDAMGIHERCTSLVPSLHEAKIIKHWVGLRPHRSTVRVEKEILHLNNSRMKIVHNYGHGGYGVTTSPGTSLHACALVREIMSGNSKL